MHDNASEKINTSNELDNNIATLSGIIIKAPKRVKNDAGSLLVVATMRVESEKRSAYPLEVVGFDVQALELMVYQRGQRITVTGRTEWKRGYTIIAQQLS